MNVSRTMAPNRIIVTHRYAVTTGNASLCTFFIRRSFPCRAPSRRSPSGPPHALDHPGDGSDDRAEDGTGHKTAEERGDAKNDGLQAGIEHTFEVAAESRRAT